MVATVLVVGDTCGIFQLLDLWKELLSYSVYATSSCTEALDVLNANKIDILVTNVQILETDGCEFFEKAVDVRKALQFIVIGGQEERSVAVEMMARCAVAYIQKPIYPKELRIHIERCIETLRIKAQLKTEMANRRQVEEDCENALCSRIAISALLETGLEPLSLAKQIDVALEIILAVPRLSLQRRGSVFLMDEASGCLQLAGYKSLLEQSEKPEERAGFCTQVPLGHCLCGKAAERREIIFSNHLDDDHEIHLDGTPAHGHYCAPIISKNHLLGVLNLYVTAGHQRNKDEDAFITTIANTLAVIIEHRKMEADLKKAGERLRHLAYHDPLTGLRNRQSFNTVIDKIFFSMQSTVRSTNRRQDDTYLQGGFLAILDIDHFKRVNDAYGHLMGDEVLILFARHLKECFRTKDAAFRFGGEEFVVLLYAISEEVAQMALDRFRHMIESFDFPQVGRVTVSIGAVAIVAGELASDLIEKADRALYYSKSNGRNQTNFYHKLVASGDLEDIDHGAGEIDLWE